MLNAVAPLVLHFLLLTCTALSAAKSLLKLRGVLRRLSQIIENKASTVGVGGDYGSRDNFANLSTI